MTEKLLTGTLSLNTDRFSRDKAHMWKAGWGGVGWSKGFIKPGCQYRPVMMQTIAMSGVMLECGWD